MHLSCSAESASRALQTVGHAWGICRRLYDWAKTRMTREQSPIGTNFLKSIHLVAGGSTTPVKKRLGDKLHQLMQK